MPIWLFLEIRQYESLDMTRKQVDCPRRGERMTLVAQLGFQYPPPPGSEATEI